MTDNNYEFSLGDGFYNQQTGLWDYLVIKRPDQIHGVHDATDGTSEMISIEDVPDESDVDRNIRANIAFDKFVEEQSGEGEDPASH